MLRERHKGGDLVLVHAPHHHHVELQGGVPGGGEGAQRRERGEAVRDLGEGQGGGAGVETEEGCVGREGQAVEGAGAQGEDDDRVWRIVIGPLYLWSCIVRRVTQRFRKGWGGGREGGLGEVQHGGGRGALSIKPCSGGLGWPGCAVDHSGAAPVAAAACAAPSRYAAGESAASPQLQRSVNGAQHAVVAAPPRHGLKALRAQRVQRDIEEAQAWQGARGKGQVVAECAVALSK